MANPHIKTYQFRDVMLGNGDEVRLKIEITVNAEGTTETIISEDENVFISDIGEKVEDYDFEDALLSPSFYSAVLTAIENGNFEKYFFDEGESIFEDADKNALVTFDIKYAGTSTWVNDFIGNIIIDSLEYDPDQTEFNFEAAPDMSKLSQTMLFDLDGAPINPFGYSMATPPRPGDNTNFILIKNILLDCYKLVNPDLVTGDIEIEHDWNFWGRWYDPIDPESVYGDAFDITLDEVEIDIYPLFFDQGYGCSSVADVLIKLAIEFGCFTGMLSRNKVFFKKMFNPNSFQNYNLNNESYYNFKKKYNFNPISYCRVNVRESVWIGGTGNYVDYNYYTFHAPNENAFTGLKDSYKEISTLTIGAMWTSFYIASNLRATRPVSGYGSDLVHTICGASDPAFHYPPTSTVWAVYPGHQDIVPTAQLLVDFWYLFRSQIKHLRVDPIVAPGNEHSITKNPIFKGRKYQPLNVKKNYKDCKATIQGLIIE